MRNCSHEMRTPITVARGFAEMVRSALPTQQSRDDIDVVVDELDKLAAMARRLLVLADAYESTDFDLAPVDLGRPRPALDPALAADRRPPWVLEAPSAVVEADESRLEAAVDALVENAVKFTVDGDVIVMRSCPLRGGGGDRGRGPRHRLRPLTRGRRQPACGVVRAPRHRPRPGHRPRGRRGARRHADGRRRARRRRPAAHRAPLLALHAIGAPARPGGIRRAHAGARPRRRRSPAGRGCSPRRSARRCRRPRLGSSA